MLIAATGYTDLVEKRHTAHTARVSVYNTTKTVPSRGLTASYYTFPANTDLSPADWTTGATIAASGLTEFSTVMGFDWGQGSPPPVGQVDNYGGIWEGYFYARFTGTYRLYFDSSIQCGTRLTFDSALKTVYTDADSNTGNTWWTTNQFEPFQNSVRESYVDVVCTANTWYPVKFEFFTGQNLAGASNAYFAVKYREPQGVSSVYGEFGEVKAVACESDENTKILSCGVMNYTNSFETPTVLTGVVSVETDRGFGSIGQSVFNVLLSPVGNISSATPSGSTKSLVVDSTNGFPEAGVLVLGSYRLPYTSKTSTTFTLTDFFDVVGAGGNIVSLGDTPYAYDDAANAFGAIKPFRLVHIETGLDDGSGNIEYVSNMWGMIAKNPKVAKTSDGVTKLTVTVNDFGIYLNDYARNYPDNASYSMAGYYEPNKTGRSPNGQTRPVCYDGWFLDDAMRDMMVKGNVDPVWSYGRKKIANGTTFANTYGDYRVRGETVYLDKRRQYGNPENISESDADEEYLWYFGYGTRLLENIYSLCKNFGYGFGFGADGFLNFRGIDLPKDSLYARDYQWADPSGDVFISVTDYASWTRVPSLDSIRGAYIESSTTLKPIVFNVIGRYAQLIMPRIVANTKAKIKVDGANITEITVDNVQQAVVGGVVDTTTTVPWEYYDGYDTSRGFNPCILFIDLGTYDSHSITVEHSGTGAGVAVNGMFVYEQLSEYPVNGYTTDDIGGLTDTVNIEDMRNEVIVIGTLLGLFQDNVGNIVNPSNPISQHVSSSAVDISSLYDITVKNYLGRRVPFEIYNPSIFTKSRADFLSTSVLEKYRRMQHAPDFNLTKPDSTLELMDTITISDDHTGLVTSSKPLWVVGYKEQMTVDKHTMDVKLTGHKPLFSYIERPEVELSDYNNEPIINIEFKMSGKRISGDDGTYVSANSISVDTDPGWDTNQWAGHTLHIRGTIPPQGDGRRWRNNKPRLIVSNTSDTLVTHPDALDISDTGSGQVWTISFDPFDSDRGAPLEIHYDQVASGKVRINLYRSSDLVAELNQTKQDDIENFGSGKVVYWDGVDKLNGNLLATDDSAVDVTFFVEDKPNVVKTISSYEDNTLSYESYVIAQIQNAGLHFKTSLVNNTSNDIAWTGVMDYVGTSGDLVYYQDQDSPAWTNVSVYDMIELWSSYNSHGPLVVARRGIVRGDVARIEALDAVNDYIFVQKALMPDWERLGDAGVKIPYRIYSASLDADGSPIEREGFKNSDNGFAGLKLRLEPQIFYAQIDSANTVVAERPEGGVPQSLYDFTRSGNYIEFTNKLADISIHFNGVNYSPDWGGDISSNSAWGAVQRPIPKAGYTDVGNYNISNRGGSESTKFEEILPVIYWNQHYPTQLKSSHMTTHWGGSGPRGEAIGASVVPYFKEELKNSNGYTPFEIFQNSNSGLFALHPQWPVTGGETTNPPLSNSQLDFAHYNYYAPGKATPIPYGSLNVKVQAIKILGVDDSFVADIPYASEQKIEITEWVEVSSMTTGIVNLSNYELDFTSAIATFNDSILMSSYTSFFAQTEDGILSDEAGAVIFRFAIEIRDRAGRLPVGCRAGKETKGQNLGNPFGYASTPMYVDMLWRPEDAESLTPVSLAYNGDKLEHGGNVSGRADAYWSGYTTLYITRGWR